MFMAVVKFTDDDTPQINIFNTVEQSNFIVEDLRITRKATQKDADPIWWYATRACTGMAFTRCENFTVRNCVISMHTDALGLSDCTSVTLENNLLKIWERNLSRFVAAAISRSE